jgi:hypothetical protein
VCVRGVETDMYVCEGGGEGHVCVCVRGVGTDMHVC